MQRLKITLAHQAIVFDKCFLRYCKPGLPVETEEGSVLIPLNNNLTGNEVRVLNIKEDKTEWWNGDTDVFLLHTEMHCSRIESKPC